MPSGRRSLGLKARVRLQAARCIIGGRSIVSAVKAPAGGSSKCVALVTTESPVAIVPAILLIELDSFPAY